METQQNFLRRRHLWDVLATSLPMWKYLRSNRIMSHSQHQQMGQGMGFSLCAFPWRRKEEKASNPWPIIYLVMQLMLRKINWRKKTRQEIVVEMDPGIWSEWEAVWKKKGLDHRRRKKTGERMEEREKMKRALRDNCSFSKREKRRKNKSKS